MRPHDYVCQLRILAQRKCHVAAAVGAAAHRSLVNHAERNVYRHGQRDTELHDHAPIRDRVGRRAHRQPGEQAQQADRGKCQRHRQKWRNDRVVVQAVLPQGRADVQPVAARNMPRPCGRAGRDVPASTSSARPATAVLRLVAAARAVLGFVCRRCRSLRHVGHLRAAARAAPALRRACPPASKR